MPTIKEKLYFNFDGIWSDSFNLISVSTDGGMFEETFVATRNINETAIRGSNKPLLHSVDSDPLEFELTVAFERGFSEEDLDEIIRWLFVDYYRPLYFDGKEDRVYRCMPIGDSSIIHNGLRQGLFTITMRCDSSNLYSPKTKTPKVDVINSDIVSITNDGHFDIYPEISLLKKGNGVITIESLDDGNNIFEIRNLTDLEDIYIDCEREIIETDAVGVYRYEDIVGQFPRVLFGKNRFKIIGNCEIQFRYESKYKM